MAAKIEVGDFIFGIGFVLLCYRLLFLPWLAGRKVTLSQVATSLQPIEDLNTLAVIIPARNEENNLPNLLTSLSPAREWGAQILVVDDQSTDKTADIARRHNVEVLLAPEKPKDWAGKNWACYQGAQHLLAYNKEFKYFLFTDADTTQDLAKISACLSWFKKENADLLTCIPFHENKNFWEKCIGSFHLMIMFITNAGQKHPSAARFFSIGQFLLFRREYYENSNGHLAVKNILAEDIALTEICFNKKAKFVIYPFTDVYRVRMYDSFKEFFKGWQRNFRLGMRKSSGLTWLETIAAIGCLLGLHNIFEYAVLCLFCGFTQRPYGRFSFLGALFYPVAILLFIVISLTASFKTLLGKPITWKSRNYFS